MEKHTRSRLFCHESRRAAKVESGDWESGVEWLAGFWNEILENLRVTRQKYRHDEQESLNQPGLTSYRDIIGWIIKYFDTDRFG